MIRRAGRLPALAVLAAVLVLGARLFRFIDRHAVNILFWDQWDLLNGLFESRGPWSLFAQQHGPHRQGLGHLVLRVLYPLTAWDSRVEAFSAGVVVLLATLLAVGLAWRLRGRLSVFDVCIPLVFLTTLVAEPYAGTINLAHGPIPLLLVVALAWAFSLRGDLSRVALVLVVNFYAIYTGFAVFAGLITPAVLALSLWDGWSVPRRRSLYVVAVVIATASLLSFMVDYRFEPAVECFRFPDERPTRYLGFLGLVLARPFGVVRHHPGSLPIALGALAAVAGVGLAAAARTVRSRGRDDLARTVAVLAGFSLLFAINVAVGRVCLGLEAAGSSRYVMYVMPAVLAGYLAVSEMRRWPRLRTALLVGLLLLCVSKELVFQRGSAREAAWYGGGKARWRDCYLQRATIEGCDRETGFAIYPHPERTHLAAKLDYLRARRLNLFKDAGHRD